MRVGVIGAGIAGLVTAKVLRDDGFDVVVFEREPAIGGVWNPSRTYPGLRTNNSRVSYAFSDHPYNDAADMYPTAEQVRAYLDSYVARFDLAPLLRLSTEVESITRGQSGFDIATRTATAHETVQCDRVAVCAGVFSEPNVPEIAGAERFAGTLLHSSEATDPAVFTARRVIVVGAGKSALDCAAWAASQARDCTLVFRAPHWMAPRYFPGRIPVDRLVMTRLLELFVRYHRLTRTERFLHGPARIIPALFWRATCWMFRLLLRMPAVMVPEAPLPAGFENIGVGQEFYEMARRGRVNVRRDAIASFPGGDEVLLTSGDRLTADVVIFATGWRQSLRFLSPELQATTVANGQFQLYRHILPPREQRLGFIGYASSIACPLTAEISAHWLSQCFRGELDLPTVDEIEAEVKRVQAWLADALPARQQGYFVGPYLMHHIDELMRDMALPTRRARNTFVEYLGWLSPSRYSDVHEQRRRARRPPVASR